MKQKNHHMTTEQEKVIPNSRFKINLEFLGLLSLLVVGFLSRLDTSLITIDMSKYYFAWYRYIRDSGIAVAFQEGLMEYTPAFSYLFASTTLLDSIIPKVTAIKLIPITADVISTYFVYRIVRIKYPRGNKPYWAAGVFFILPTIFINSAHWGQMDALYTLFIIISLFFFLKEKPLLGMLAYALSFSIKIQTIFFIPFLVILFLKKKIPWWQFLLIPEVYVISCIPAVLLGTSWQTVLTIYLGQIGKYRWLSGNAPNLYTFVPNEYYEPGLVIGLIVAFCTLTAWIIFTALDKKDLTRERMVLLALISVSLTPFVLPKMHDRYFYPADALSLIVAFYNPNLWFVPILFQLSSGLAYTVYLLGTSIGLVKIGAIINTVLIAYLLAYQLSRQVSSIREASDHEVVH